MPLPPAAPQRQLKHRRQIDVQVYSRGDGCWEVDAHLSDVKTHDAHLAASVRPAGTPIHDMQLRLVVNQRLDILEAGSHSRWVPYPGQCDKFGDQSGDQTVNPTVYQPGNQAGVAPADAYTRLVGLNLLQGFRQALRERVGGVQGCTHITELAQVLPTAVVQAFAGEVIDTLGDGADAQKPFQIDRCHALRSDGPTVLAHYPRWHVSAAPTRTV